MMTTKYTADGRLNIVISDPKSNFCTRVLGVIVLFLGTCLVISLIVIGWLKNKVDGNLTFL